MTVMVKTSLVTGGSERIAMCFSTYSILPGYKVEYRSTGGTKVYIGKYRCNARRRVYICIQICTYYNMLLCCMVPYGTICKYIYIYIGSMVPYGTIHKYIYIQICTYYNMILCCMVPYGTIRKYIYIYIYK